MDQQDNVADDIIELGAVSELTAGMMGVDIEGFQLQPHAGLSEA